MNLGGSFYYFWSLKDHRRRANSFDPAGNLSLSKCAYSARQKKLQPLLIKGHTCGRANQVSMSIFNPGQVSGQGRRM